MVREVALFMKDFVYHNPQTLTEACELLKKYKGSGYALAGGTDIIPKIYHKQVVAEHLINLKNIPELNQIEYDPKTGLDLGALVKFNEIIYSEVIQKQYPILVEVCKQIASHQIRNLATIGGNLCNAAPSADSAPILIALDSVVEIVEPNEKSRTEKLEDFFTGPGSTSLKDGEILTKITIPPMDQQLGLSLGMAYHKHGTRNALEIAVVGVAAMIQLKEGTDKCLSCRIVVGASAPTPIRIPKAEELLINSKITEPIIEKAAVEAQKAVKPISDVRASDEYRSEMAKVLCKRALELAFSRARKRIDDPNNDDDNDEDNAG
jgi:carbon-monoxide dehydrogenase medium subunit